MKKKSSHTRATLFLLNLNSRMKMKKISLYSLYYSYYWHYWYCSIHSIFLRSALPLCYAKNSLHFGHTQYCCFVFLL